MDVAIASTALVALTVPLAAIALAVKATSPGPILFVQDRYGKDRKTFRCLKFRTMTVCEKPGEFVQATKGDARITRIGAILRRTSLDEFPQLVNVLRGDMSLVGPRPHPIKLDDDFAPRIPGYDGRFAVRPGITGLAQIGGHRGPTETVEVMKARIDMDLEYVATRSILGDLRILLRTIPAVLRCSGAF
jgi:putative colanic acid biosynthesis UDP-glucose lipid carrier transferase